ncbi:MAG: elongation factor P maturation arginine rhamnosyltransferase EarP [Pseudobdellovibrionaceae bacterium]
MNSSPTPIKTVDIFCRVVDNYGDIGVCWRLARQLACDHTINVRLLLDDLSALAALQPDHPAGVSVIKWGENLAYTQAADVVIEAFACTLPDYVLDVLKEQKPVWIDLEYLSAEDWTASCHAIPSRHPATGLLKTLFFPGFDARTGGILREKGLIEARNSFLADKKAQNIWRKAHNLPRIDINCTDISLFAYKTAPVEAFLRGCETSPSPVRVFAPSPAGKENVTVHGALTLYNIPFLPQQEYDRLLWTCDLNFVRGEDSFVRAQLAAKPFIWNIYVQDENTHLIKLDAFLNTLKPFYGVQSWERLVFLHKMWNEDARKSGDMGPEIFKSLAGLRSGAENWADYLVGQSDLATRLLAFVQSQKSI